MLSFQPLPFPAPVPTQDQWHSRRNATDHRTFRTLDAPVAAWRRAQAFERFLAAHPPREPAFNVERLPLYGKLHVVLPVQPSTDAQDKTTLVPHFTELRVNEPMETDPSVSFSTQVHGEAHSSDKSNAPRTIKSTHLARSADISRSSSISSTEALVPQSIDAPSLDAAQEPKLDITLAAPTPANSPVLRAQAPVFTPRAASDATQVSILRRSNAIKRGSRHMWHLERLPKYLDEE